MPYQGRNQLARDRRQLIRVPQDRLPQDRVSQDRLLSRNQRQLIRLPRNICQLNRLPQKSPTSADRGRRRADAFLDIIQARVRGVRPQRTPIEIIITVLHAGLHGSAEPSDLAMMADGEIIAASTARRYCCDAGVVVAHVDAQGVPLSVGRKTRTIPAAIKRALLLRDRTCRFPGYAQPLRRRPSH